MVMSVHLFLSDEDGNQIDGESTTAEIAGVDVEKSIECANFEYHFSRVLPGGTVDPSPISITKRIDKSSPLLYVLLGMGGLLEGEFQAFRPSTSGDGTDEHYLTVTGSRGRVVAVSFVSDAFGQGRSDEPYESVMFLFDAVKVEYIKGGIIGEIEFKAAKK